MAFEIASIQALKKGVSDASPILPKPVMRPSVTAPDAGTGGVMRYLNGKRGRS